MFLNFCFKRSKQQLSKRAYVTGLNAKCDLHAFEYCKSNRTYSRLWLL